MTVSRLLADPPTFGQRGSQHELTVPRTSLVYLYTEVIPIHFPLRITSYTVHNPVFSITSGFLMSKPPWFPLIHFYSCLSTFLLFCQLCIFFQGFLSFTCHRISCCVAISHISHLVIFFQLCITSHGFLVLYVSPNIIFFQLYFNLTLFSLRYISLLMSLSWSISLTFSLMIFTYFQPHYSFLTV